MTLHGEIMNIPHNRDVTGSLNEQINYKLGHRDARHAAAELSLKYERYIEELEQLEQLLIEAERYTCWKTNLKNVRKECGL